MLRSSAQQHEMTHPVRAKRTHHPIVPYHCVAVGGCSQGKRGNVSPLSLFLTVLILALFTGRLWSRLGLWSNEKNFDG